MNLFRRNPTPEATAGVGSFDLLRARLEVEIPRPAVIAITSSTSLDGAEISARGLAHSLATTGYPTLFIDTVPSIRGSAKPTAGPTLEEIGRQIEPASGGGNLAVLALGDVSLQKTTSQRNIHAALESLRGKFDYVVMNTEVGVASSFSTSVVAAADAVLVAVKTGRRQKAADAQLAALLNRLGVRFLGVLAVDSSITNADSNIIPGPGISKEVRRNSAVHVEKEYAR